MSLHGSATALAGCSTCSQRTQHAFCNLSQEALQSLDQVSFAFPYPERAVLFSENEPCRGVFILCSGRAKLSTASRSGKVLLLRTAEAGEVLGLSSALSGTNYDLTAEIVAPATVRFVKRQEFIHFLQTFAEGNQQVIRALTQEYEKALDRLRTLAWLSTATARVAQLLLHIGSDGKGSRRHKDGVPLTQEQIAQMTATTRETVTRLLVQLRRDRIISLRGSDVVIRNRAALQRLAS